jgi:hypothetical protein
VGSVVGNLFLGSIDTLAGSFQFVYRHSTQIEKPELLQIAFWNSSQDILTLLTIILVAGKNY